MLSELKRVYNVNLTKCIDLLKGSDKILKGKRKEIGDQINKLRSGLDKLDDARKQVEVMNIQSEEKRGEVSKEQKACEELMGEILKKKSNVDEQIKLLNLKELRLVKIKQRLRKRHLTQRKNLGKLNQH